MNANWPLADVVAKYSCLLSAAISLTVAMPTGFPPASRSTPLQEDGRVECREGTRKNTRKRKKARAISRDQESIAKHYTRIDLVHDLGAGLVAIAATRVL